MPDQHIVADKSIEITVDKLADLGASGEISDLVADLETLDVQPLAELSVTDTPSREDYERAASHR